MIRIAGKQLEAVKQQIGSKEVKGNRINFLGNTPNKGKHLTPKL